MTGRTIVYGYIEGACSGLAAIDERIRTLNETAIAALPETDEAPVLVRSMLSISGSSPSAASYKNHVIHFGGSLMTMDHDWDRWRQKFEMLLRRLCWESAKAHLVSDTGEPCTYAWLADEQSIRGMFTEHILRPVTGWVAVGGPRRHKAK